MLKKYRDIELREITIEIDERTGLHHGEGEQRVVRIFDVTGTQYSFTLALRYPCVSPLENSDSIVLDFAKCKILDDSYRSHKHDLEADNSPRKAIMVSNSTEDSTKFHSLYSWGSDERRQFYINHLLATRLHIEEERLGRQIIIRSLRSTNGIPFKQLLELAHFPNVAIENALNVLLNEENVALVEGNLVLVGNPQSEKIGFK